VLSRRLALKTVFENMDVWALAGQSNMEGCALLAGSMPSDARVWCFTTAGIWDIAAEPLHDEASRQPSDKEPVGAGLGLSFGCAMADALERPVGLIPCAYGGSSLKDWMHRQKDDGTESLYGDMLKQVSRAGGNLRGILWYQGEADCTAQLAPSYGQRLAEWISTVRADLKRPDLPVVVVQLGRFVPHASELVLWDPVREALRRLPLNVPYTAVTSAIDLGLTDLIHIDTQGLIRLGRRMARLALGLMNDRDSAPGPQVVRIRRQQILRDGPGGRGPMGMAYVATSGVTGGWNPRQHISGFEVRDHDGQPRDDVFLINAWVDESDLTSIRLLLTAPPDDSVRIGYGLGQNPYCNAVDDADMPLCAFMPMEITD
jgi:sialate O-acetylesterase